MLLLQTSQAKEKNMTDSRLIFKKLKPPQSAKPVLNFNQSPSNSSSWKKVSDTKRSIAKSPRTKEKENK